MGVPVKMVAHSRHHFQVGKLSRTSVGVTGVWSRAGGGDSTPQIVVPVVGVRI